MKMCLDLRSLSRLGPTLLAGLLLATSAQAGPFGLFGNRLGERGGESSAARESTAGREAPAGVRTVHNVAYGSDPAQVFDVFLPAEQAAEGAPVILMFHGGGWKRGDKSMRMSLDSKVERWVARGFIFITANYRLLPEAEVEQQLRDVARAVSVAQDKAAEWGGDRRRVILMGHSAGAHLVALYSSAPSRFAEPNAAPVLGTVALDSAAMDVTRIMEQKHFKLYDRPFGTDPDYWKAMSPIHRLERGAPPILAVCSSRRQESCDQAGKFTERSRWLGNRAEVLPEDLSHGEINSQLGLDGAYTDAVEKFMAGLDGEVARRLGRR